MPSITLNYPDNAFGAKLAEGLGWTPNIEVGGNIVPNPETRKQWVERWYKEHAIRIVRTQLAEEAAEAARAAEEAKPVPTVTVVQN